MYNFLLSPVGFSKANQCAKAHPPGRDQ